MLFYCMPSSDLPLTELVMNKVFIEFSFKEPL